MFRAVLLSAILAAVAGAAAGQPPAAPGRAAPDRELAAVNIEYKGTTVWVPSTFIVKRGERVRLTLVNNAPSGLHGFAIDEVGVKAVVSNAEKDNKQVVEFTPAKAGLLRVYCHLHPAHIGGQLLVLE